MTNDSMAREALRKAFPDIPDDEVDELLTSGDVTDYSKGKILCLEGAFEDTFYILLDGEVKVSKYINEDEDRLLKRLHPGDFFGEMAIIHNAPRAATVATTKKATVLEIQREAFEQVLQHSPSVSLAMVREVSRRLRENDEMAIEDLRIKAGELAEAYQQLAEQDLARREFLTTIAHELRTPLTSASGFMQVIRMGMMEGDALKAGLEKVARNLDQIVTLTNDIMFLQEMDLILADFEPLYVSEVVSAALDGEKEFAQESGVRLNINVAPNLPTVPGDAKSLERVFKAIINNAIKFSSIGDEVNITVDQNPSFVWVKAIDQGIGIHPKDQPKIYDRFFHIEQFEGRLFGGVGLGLSIARQVIEQHGGEIEVQSRVKFGSTFTVRLRLEQKHKLII
ncbi:MAG: cyclic nucleotide-binding domain-containing protein [Chloroflexi bacterium]|nr:cyclic nucleotide-binding domain-containing protein [Chloroflexota bacterium]